MGHEKHGGIISFLKKGENVTFWQKSRKSLKSCPLLQFECTQNLKGQVFCPKRPKSPKKSPKVPKVPKSPPKSPKSAPVFGGLFGTFWDFSARTPKSPQMSQKGPQGQGCFWGSFSDFWDFWGQDPQIGARTPKTRGQVPRNAPGGP